MPTTRVGRRGQITIPKQVREQLGIDEGDRIAFITKNRDVVIQPIRKTLRDLRGIVPAEGVQDFEAVRQTVRDARARRARSESGEEPDAE